MHRAAPAVDASTAERGRKAHDPETKEATPAGRGRF
jgi:hypothetical protein